MYELKKMERYLRVNLLGPGPRLIKKNLPDRGLTKVEKHCLREDNVPVLDIDYHRQQAMLNRNAVMVTDIHKILVSFRVC